MDAGTRPEFFRRGVLFHQLRWLALWCATSWSGCVPDGARGELRQWIRNAAKQRQLERFKRLADCYDACIMQQPLSESRVHRCRIGCKKA